MGNIVLEKERSYYMNDRINSNKILGLSHYVMVFLIALIVSCSKDKDPSPVHNIDPDAISVSLTKIYAPETGVRVDYSHVFFSMIGKTIYYGATSISDGKPRFLSYNTTSNSYSEALAVTDDLCACGYSGKLVNDGKKMYLFANGSAAYDVTANTWTALNYPNSARDGEVGSAIYSGNIYSLGGRSRPKEFRYYNVKDNTWLGLPDYLYPTSHSGVAGVDNKIYVLGGRSADKKFSVFDLSTRSWEALPDLPFNYSSAPTMSTVVVYKDLIWLLDWQTMKLHIYNPSMQKWKAQPLATGVTSSFSVSLLTNGDKLYIAKALMNSTTVEYHEVTVSY